MVIQDYCGVPDKIIIVDFSYNFEDLSVLRSYYPGVEILIIDHHKTAVGNQASVPGEIVGIQWVIDTEAPGACLVVDKFFFPDSQKHPLVAAVADYDGWQFKLPYTKEINEALLLYKHKDLLETVFSDLYSSGGKLDQLVNHGTILLKAKMNRVDMMSKKMKMISFEGHTVPFCNVTDSINEVAHHLLEKFPEALFCIVYYDDFNTGFRRYSLRSRDFDLISIAKKYGGGGHENACGFSIPIAII